MCIKIWELQFASLLFYVKIRYIYYLPLTRGIREMVVAARKIHTQKLRKPAAELNPPSLFISCTEWTYQLCDLMEIYGKIFKTTKNSVAFNCIYWLTTHKSVCIENCRPPVLLLYDFCADCRLITNDKLSGKMVFLSTELSFCPCNC